MLSPCQPPHRNATWGALAETRAAAYLIDRGLHLMARNLHCRAGEIDLVCLDGDVLVIVEVRHRSRGDFGGALASVTFRKRRRLIRATQHYWQGRPDWRNRRLRFDVVAMDGPADAPVITWIKDAFRAP